MPNYTFPGVPEDKLFDHVVEQAKAAEAAGFDLVTVMDHFYQIRGVGPETAPMLEAYSALAALATQTRKVKLGTLVTGVTYRNPALLAKTAVTVDHLAGGRLEFGIGAAWAEIEHEMYGFDGLDHRVGRLSESLQIIKSLFTQERTNFEGRYYHFKDAIANPKPLQKPYPPIWIGASGQTTMRLVARHADVWNIAGGDPDRVDELTAMLDEACAAVGRDPSEIRHSIQFGWDGKESNELLELSGRFLEQGVTEQVVYLRGEEPAKLAGKVAELLPDLRRLQPVPS